MINENVLFDYIEATNAPIRAKLTLECIETLLAYNVLDIIPVLETLILNDDLDSQTKQLRIKEELIGAIKEVLLNIGLVPYQNIQDFVPAFQIAKAMMLAVNEYQSEYILDNTFIADEDTPDIEKIHSIAYLIEKVSEYHFYETIHSIDDNVVEQLLTVLNSTVVIEYTSDDPKIVQRYNDFIKGRKTGVIFNYVANTGTIGTLDSSDLLPLVQHDILALPLPDRAYDIISGVLITNTPEDQLETEISSWIKYLSDNDEEVRLLERSVKLSLEDLQKLQQTGL